ncbi:hypothetical protein FB45DRAFT_869208 [Roridomyces roridus]|uniref:Uncharacterized protein n=1 Tax=Roridomyces roridus TaxID=1738132 RepID=A0AAD7BNQ2_9AGAR|nr:hypothetical protein FB45DRAFT_869208 [Roridomyces roridus]
MWQAFNTVQAHPRAIAATSEHGLATACGRLTGSRSRSGTLDPFRSDAAANPTADLYHISAPPSHPSRPTQLACKCFSNLNDNTELKRRVANLEQRVSGAENTLNQRGGGVSRVKTRTTNVAVSHQHHDAAAARRHIPPNPTSSPTSDTRRKPLRNPSSPSLVGDTGSIAHLSAFFSRIWVEGLDYMKTSRGQRIRNLQLFYPPTFAVEREPPTVAVPVASVNKLIQLESLGNYPRPNEPHPVGIISAAQETIEIISAYTFSYRVDLSIFLRLTQGWHLLRVLFPSFLCSMTLGSSISDQPDFLGYAYVPLGSAADVHPVPLPHWLAGLSRVKGNALKQHIW